MTDTFTLPAAPLVEPPPPVRRTITNQRPRGRRLGLGRRIPGGRLLGPLLVLAVWGLASATGQLDPRTLPAPWDVAQTGWELAKEGSLGRDILTSLGRAAKGFTVGFVIAVGLALLAGLTRVGEALIDGTVQVNRSIPALGVIPLFIVWLGIGESFKVAIIAMIVYIP